MQTKLSLMFLVIILAAATLTACGLSQTAPEVVEAYWQALVDKDPVTAVTLSCLDWEEQARAEANSFEAVEVRLEGVTCSISTEGDGDAVVFCDGSIVANYGGEDTSISLADRAYITVMEDGEWKMCGYESR